MRKRSSILALSLAAIMCAALTGTAAASTTLGSIPPVDGGAGGCTLCTFVQTGTDPASPSYAIPSNGVLTSFSARVGSKVDASDWIKFQVDHHVISNSYAVDFSTAQIPIPASANSMVLKVPASVVVHTGQILGVEINSGANGSNTSPFAYTSASEDQVGSFPINPVVGEAANLNGPPSHDRLLNIQAVLEPDADKDGFGDETQDCFPTDATRHGATCPDTLAPKLLSLSSKNAKFRVNTKGAVISKTKPKGTTIKFSTSEDAKLTFSITRSVKSSKTKKTTYKIVKSFSRSAKAGDNSFSFSGRYRDAKGKKRALAPGKYKLAATPTDAAGNVGLPRSISFTITS